MNIVEIITTYRLEIIIAIMGLIILFLIYYVYQKDTQYTKNIRSIASVVEELNRDIFYLRNKLTETTKQLQHNKRTLSDEEIYSEIERTVYDMIQPLALSLKEVQNSITAIDTQLESRITHLENGVKQINIPSSIHANDDEKIISLYKQGVSIETIAKELHLAKPEVEFVLKINQIK
jgi:uncharacterized protein YoxC